jgi:uncharacterized repeat protein (TIGR02543 family)
MPKAIKQNVKFIIAIFLTIVLIVVVCLLNIAETPTQAPSQDSNLIYQTQKSTDTQAIKDRPKCTVTFDAAGGVDAPEPILVERDSEIGEIAKNPTRLKYAFAGWYTEPRGGTKVNASTIITSDCTLYARWTSQPCGFCAPE